MAVLLALSSALVYGVGDWFGGRAARHQAAIIVAGVGQVVSLALVVAWVLLAGTALPATATLVWGAAGGVFGALGIAGLYHGFAHGDVTVVAPLSAVVGAVVPVIGALVLGERPSALGYLGIVLAVVAVALISGALGTHTHNTPPRIVALAVGVGACFGLLFIALERTDEGSGLWPLVAARCVSVPALLLLAGVGRLRPQSHRASLVTAAGVGVVDMAANVLYLEATRRGLLSIVAVVSSLYPGTTVGLAFAVDKEKVHRWQALGMALAVAALVLVSLSRS